MKKHLVLPGYERWHKSEAVGSSFKCTEFSMSVKDSESGLQWTCFTTFFLCHVERGLQNLEAKVVHISKLRDGRGIWGTSIYDPCYTPCALLMLSFNANEEGIHYLCLKSDTHEWHTGTAWVALSKCSGNAYEVYSFRFIYLGYHISVYLYKKVFIMHAQCKHVNDREMVLLQFVDHGRNFFFLL